MTMAVLGWLLAAVRRAVAVGRSRSVASATMRRARSVSLALVGFRSTMRLPKTLPSWTMVAVVSMLQTIFWAVPALRRVEPVRISGPVSISMATSAWGL